MKVCPHCGKDYGNEVTFCVECGTLLEKIEDPPRDSLTENIKFALNLAGSNLKIFYPSLIILGGSIIMGIIMILTFGISLYNFGAPEAPSFSGGMILGFLIIWIGGMYLGLVSIPFTQHVYKNAILEEEIDLRESFRYGRSMFLQYLGAVIAALLIFMTLALALFSFFPAVFDLPPEIISSPENLDYWTLLRSMSWILVLVPFFAFYGLAVYVMAWDNTGLIPALRSSYYYLRGRFVDLLVLLVLEIVSSIVVMEVPFGFILGQIITVIFNVALIDNYLSYQRSQA